RAGWRAPARAHAVDEETLRQRRAGGVLSGPRPANSSLASWSGCYSRRLPTMFRINIFFAFFTTCALAVAAPSATANFDDAPGRPAEISASAYEYRADR